MHSQFQYILCDGTYVNLALEWNVVPLALMCVVRSEE